MNAGVHRRRRGGDPQRVTVHAAFAEELTGPQNADNGFLGPQGPARRDHDGYLPKSDWTANMGIARIGIKPVMIAGRASLWASGHDSRFRASS
jgi:hypothetical protein